jgi:hypothetical protein
MNLQRFITNLFLGQLGKSPHVAVKVLQEIRL